MSDEEKSQGILVTAAKAVGSVAGAVGSVAGKIASLAPGGAAHSEATPPPPPPAQTPTDRTEDGKFIKKHKSRLPRKQKKMMARKELASRAVGI